MKRLFLLSIPTLSLLVQSSVAAQPSPSPGLQRRPAVRVTPGGEVIRPAPPPTAAAPGAPAAPPTGTGTTSGAGTGGTPSPGGAAAGSPATGAAAGTTPGASPATTPGGKALGDTSKLQQFEQSMEFEPRSPNYKVSFSLEDADLSELVKVIGQLTGKRFIFGPKVKNIKATVYSPEKVTVSEAYQAFLSVLEANGLTVVPHGRFLKIIETAASSTQGTQIYGKGQQSPNEERYVTRIHRMSHVSADDASNVLSKFKSKDADITVYGPGNLLIITDTGSNIRRMLSLLEEIDVGGAGDQMFIEPIHYASASDIANRVNELFDLKGGGSGGGGAPNPKGGAPAQGGASATGGDLHVAKLIADDRSNSIVIVSTERAYLRVLELIKRLDVPQTGEGEIHVLALQHADATDLTKTLNDIITGANQAGTPAQGGAGKTPGPSPASGIFEGGIKVSADKATNSIVVTSSLRDYASLRLVIDKLDQPRRQVFIEAVIMDLQLKRSSGFGVSFHGADNFSNGSAGDGLVYGGNKVLNTVLPLPSDPDALQGFALGVKGPGVSGTQSLLGTGISIPAFGTFVQALAQTGDSDLLSTPHILALDNEDAEINVGDNIPLQTNATPILAGLGGAGATAGGLAGIGGSSLGGFGSPRQDVGTKVKIKPHLNDSNQVRLDVTEEISEQGAPLGGTLGAIPISKRTATTKLVVEDQQTVVIGGLIRNVNGRAEDKVPVLGDIPVLGALFRKRTDTVEKRNLVLILTPYIIREQADLRAVFERKMQERQEYLDRYFIFTDQNEYTPPRDYSRTNGLVEETRQAFFQIEEKKRLDELTRPKDLKGHEPQQPLEMPAASRHLGAAPGTAPDPASPIKMTPQIRNVERVEK